MRRGGSLYKLSILQTPFPARRGGGRGWRVESRRNMAGYLQDGRAQTLMWTKLMRDFRTNVVFGTGNSLRAKWTCAAAALSSTETWAARSIQGHFSAQEIGPNGVSLARHCAAGMFGEEYSAPGEE